MICLYNSLIVFFVCFLCVNYFYFYFAIYTNHIYVMTYSDP